MCTVTSLFLVRALSDGRGLVGDPQGIDVFFFSLLYGVPTPPSDSSQGRASRFQSAARAGATLPEDASVLPVLPEAPRSAFRPKKQSWSHFEGPGP